MTRKERAAGIIPLFKQIYPDVKFKLKHIAKSKILCTANSNGIKAVMDNGIRILENIM